MFDDYKYVLASDVDERAGLGLELHTTDGVVLAEVFRHDDHPATSFTCFTHQPIPFPVLKKFVGRAEATLFDGCGRDRPGPLRGSG